jgi:hypothetical protein
MTYQWTGFDKGYNFIIENASIRIHMRKIRLHKISNTFAPRGTCLLPWAIQDPFSQRPVGLLNETQFTTKIVGKTSLGNSYFIL